MIKLKTVRVLVLGKARRLTRDGEAGAQIEPTLTGRYDPVV